MALLAIRSTFAVAGQTASTVVAHGVMEHESGLERMGKFATGDYVKVEFKHEASGESEWMWVQVRESNDKERIVFGKLDNEPIVNTCG